MPKRGTTTKTGPRPLRGTTDETRMRLIRAAAEEFARVGYDGTDSTKISARAGYAAGTFYKHFEDKREVFMAAYAHWVEDEWAAVRELVSGGTSARARAAAITRFYLELHAKSRVFRASLRVLAANDAVVRREYQAQRRRQLDWLEAIRGGRSGKAQRERDALLLYTLERAGDALAEGEDKALGLRRATMVGLISELVASGLARDRRD